MGCLAPTLVHAALLVFSFKRQVRGSERPLNVVLCFGCLSGVQTLQPSKFTPRCKGEESGRFACISHTNHGQAEVERHPRQRAVHSVWMRSALQPASRFEQQSGSRGRGREATHLVQQATVTHRCVQVLGRFSLEKQAWSNAHVAGHEVPEHRTYSTRTQSSCEG